MLTKVPAPLVVVLILAVAGCGGDEGNPPPDHVDSPGGSVPFGATAFSPDGLKYAREIDPRDTGMIGVFSTRDDHSIVEFDAWDGSAPNPPKGLAWHPDNTKLAVMYHKCWQSGVTRNWAVELSIVTVHDAESGEVLYTELFCGYHHAMRFLPDGRLLIGESQVIEVPSGRPCEALESPPTDGAKFTCP